MTKEGNYTRSTALRDGADAAAVNEAFVNALSVAAEQEPVAWQWRSRIMGGAWDAWENGRYGHIPPPFMEVEERQIPASPHPVEPKAEADTIAALQEELARLKAGINRGCKFRLFERVRKIRGSSWQGCIVGFYSTSLTPIGYCVESEREPGSVQLYPEAALEALGGSDA